MGSKLFEAFDRAAQRYPGTGIEFISLTKQIETTTPGGKLIFHLMGALAEFERDLNREQTNAELAAAKARGHVSNTHHPKMPHRVTLSRSEEPVTKGSEMLRCAQHEHPRYPACDELFLL